MRGAFSQYHDTRLARPPNPPSARIASRCRLRISVSLFKPRDAAKMPRNPAEDALYRLTLAGDLFKEQVLARLDPTERGMLRLVNKDLRLAVRLYSYRQPWTFKVSDFVGSVERFEWALKHKILGLSPLD